VLDNADTIVYIGIQGKDDMMSNESERKSARAGLPDGWERVTYILRTEYRKKIERKAQDERRSIKNTLDIILEKELKDKPKRRR